MMNEMTCYLNTHPEIQRVVLLVDNNYEYDNIVDFCSNISIKKLILVGSLSKEKVETIQSNLQKGMQNGMFSTLDSFEYADIIDFHGIAGNWALCAEWCSAKTVRKALEWKPTQLLATIWEGYITAFKIWEEFKEFCSYIQIKTLRWNSAPQILEWQKDETNDIELSVIFPMYNVAAYLEECLSSVTEWNAPYVEFLFVNDGSPDNSREIVLEWAKKDSRIKLLDKPNGGCASARQYGLDMAKGRYIGFIDPDDYIDESMFRKLLRAAMIGSYDISYCGYNEYYENNKETRRVPDALGVPYCNGTDDIRKIQELIMYCRVAIWRGIYKAEMLKKNNIHFYTDLRRFDDLPFKVETFAVAKSVIAVPEHLYYYRLARPGQDVSADDERLYVHFDIFNYLNQSIASTKNARLIDYLQICKIQTHLYALSKIKDEYKNTYVQRAKADLMTTDIEGRTYMIAQKYIGNEQAEYYKAIINEDLAALVNLSK